MGVKTTAQNQMSDLYFLYTFLFWGHRKVHNKSDGVKRLGSPKTLDRTIIYRAVLGFWGRNHDM